MFKEEPRKVCFTYDLFLNLEGNPPVNHLRCEKLTFNNPTIEFRYKLLMAGGVSVPRAGGPWPPAPHDGLGCSIVASARFHLRSRTGSLGVGAPGDLPGASLQCVGGPRVPEGQVARAAPGSAGEVPGAPRLCWEGLPSHWLAL